MILLLSTSDTDLLSARASEGPVRYRLGNPARLAAEELPALLEGTELVVVRLLGGRRAWQEGLDALLMRPPPGDRADRRTGPRRPADGAVHRPGRHRRRGARLPGPRRRGQPRRARRLPLRHRAAHRPRLRAARLRPGLGPAGAHRPHHRGPDRRGALLPRPPHERQHRLRGDPLPRDRGPGRPGPRLLLRLAARRRAGAAGRPRRGGRPRHHRARRRMAPARPTPRPHGRRGGLGRGRARRPGPADPPGALPDLVARPLGGERRRPVPAGHGHPDRRARVRRPS